MSKIAIIYTTFLRDELMHKTLATIFNNWHKDFVLFVLYQGSGDIINWEDDSPKVEQRFVQLPFDYGLSASRNYGVQLAKAAGCEYCLITADSIKFIPETVQQLDQAKQFLNSTLGAGILGFNLKGRTPWEYNMGLANGRFQLYSTGPFSMASVDSPDLFVKRCDICKNFFLAKTDALIEVPWDETLKLSEHEDFFWRFKQSTWEVWYTQDISAEYIDEKPGPYLKYRSRMYGEFRNMLSKKYNLTGWVEYK